MTVAGTEALEGSLFDDRYFIERTLGSGGMGKVYLASDKLLPGEKIALKLLHAEVAHDQSLQARFLREVQLTRKVTHPNVVRTFDVGTHGGKLYFTMEYVDGKTLRDHIAGSPLPTSETVQILSEILEGLSAIHALEIVHRDLKTSNVIVMPDGRVKISDFGVARPGASELTQADELLGSATNIAPEMWKEGNGNVLTDMYALGVIAYEMATGILPFDGRTPHELMYKHIQVDPVPPAEVESSVPRWLNSLILRMLDKDPALRPQSALDALAEIAQRQRKSTVESASLPPYDEISDEVSLEDEALAGCDSPLFDPCTESDLEGDLPEVQSARPRALTEELPEFARLSFQSEPSVLRSTQQVEDDGREEPSPLSPALSFVQGISLLLIFLICSILLGGILPSEKPESWSQMLGVVGGSATIAICWMAAVLSPLVLLSQKRWRTTKRSLMAAGSGAGVILLTCFVLLETYSVQFFGGRPVSHLTAASHAMLSLVADAVTLGIDGQRLRVGIAGNDVLFVRSAHPSALSQAGFLACIFFWTFLYSYVFLRAWRNEEAGPRLEGVLLVAILLLGLSWALTTALTATVLPPDVTATLRIGAFSRTLPVGPLAGALAMWLLLPFSVMGRQLLAARRASASSF